MNTPTTMEIEMFLATMSTQERTELAARLWDTVDGRLTDALREWTANPRQPRSLEPGTLALLEGREWTPCTEELPPTLTRVLATRQYGPSPEDRNVSILGRIDARWFFPHGPECPHPVIAWQHLPEPWEGEA